MNPDDISALESKKLKIRLFIVLIILAFFAYLVLIRPVLKAAI